MATPYQTPLSHRLQRELFIQPLIRDALYEELKRIIREHHGVPLEVGGMPDHVHIVAWLKPEPSVAKILQFINGGSSAWVNQQEHYPGKFYWQEGYGAFTVSPPQLAGVREYVQNQAEHHRYRLFQEEFRRFLDAYEMEYGERYLWD